MHYGIVLENYKRQNWSKKFLEELKQVKLQTTASQYSLTTYLREFEFLDRQRKELDKAIKELAASPSFNSQAGLLLKAPSIGINTAMTFLSEIGDIKRFRTLDQLCCYFGLIPNTHSSGEKDIVGRNTRRGNKFIITIEMDMIFSITITFMAQLGK